MSLVISIISLIVLSFVIFGGLLSFRYRVEGWFTSSMTVCSKIIRLIRISASIFTVSAFYTIKIPKCSKFQVSQNSKSDSKASHKI